MKRTFLALADATVFEGQAFGAEGEAIGEVVFNTGMAGYQEILTDPSYRGQIVTMTSPHIGNTGINPEDVESLRPWVEGFIVKEASAYPSSWRSRMTLDDYLREHGIVGIQGIDTRALTQHIRDRGAQEGIISTVDEDPKSLVAKAQASPGLIGRDLVKEVSCTEPYAWKQGAWVLAAGYEEPKAEDREAGGEQKQLDLFGAAKGPPTTEGRYRVVVYDCGVKFNILRRLVEYGCDVTVVPAFTSAEEVLALDPDGIVLSNGPGDPEGVPYVIENVGKLVGKRPIFGICLGHQLLALAMGGRTFKLKFGHHGVNHPVKDLTTGKVQITTQNHGFAVDLDSFKGRKAAFTMTHVNLNDGTCEGMRHKELPVFSVQYHPETSPGPHDASYLFREFVSLMAGARR